MNFCVISPATGLEMYSTLSKTHLVLAHVRNKTYREFYRKRSIAGDFIILDNGAYEGFPLTTAKLLEAVEYYQPDVMIAPDRLLRPKEETLRATNAFLDKYYVTLKNRNVEIMAVPQAEKYDVMNYIRCLDKLMNDPRIKWIGLARAVGTHIYNWTQPERARASIAEFVFRELPNIHLHALGMMAGSVEELKVLKSTELIYAIDSSAPVWRGWRGRTLGMDDWEQTGSPCNFDDGHSPLQGDWRDVIIRRNLKEVGIES